MTAISDQNSISLSDLMHSRKETSRLIMPSPNNHCMFHFSVDDVFDSLIEATNSDAPLFSHPFFAFLQELHDDYGASVDLYLFLEQRVNSRRYTLRDTSDRFLAEFQEARWLRLGPHGLNYDVPPYRQDPAKQEELFDTIYAEISRFAGPDKTSCFVRLHCFSEAYELAQYWRDRKVTTLLLTDKRAVAYHLPEYKRLKLGDVGTVEHRGLRLCRSHERVENLIEENSTQICRRLDQHVDKHGFLNVFSHEKDMREPRVRQMCHYCLAYARDRRLKNC